MQNWVLFVVFNAGWRISRYHLIFHSIRTLTDIAKELLFYNDVTITVIKSDNVKNVNRTDSEKYRKKRKISLRVQQKSNLR